MAMPQSDLQRPLNSGSMTKLEEHLTWQDATLEGIFRSSPPYVWRQSLLTPELADLDRLVAPGTLLSLRLQG
ncbi:hypothetical protein STEG23_016745 [Scotinomys teguina]